MDQSERRAAVRALREAADALRGDGWRRTLNIIARSPRLAIADWLDKRADRIERG